MSESNIQAELAALRQAAIEDIEATSDADLRKELEAECGNVDGHVCGLKASMRDAAARALRDQVAVSKEQVRVASARVNEVPRIRPTIEKIKALVAGLVQVNHSVGFAFRDGKKQTDEDWKTAYDDLVEMGLLKPEDDGL